MNVDFLVTGLMLCYCTVLSDAYSQQCSNTDTAKVDCYPDGNLEANHIDCVLDGCFWCETKEIGQPKCIRDPTCSTTSTLDCFPVRTDGVSSLACNYFACNWCPTSNMTKPWCTYTQATDPQCKNNPRVDCFTPSNPKATRALCDSEANCVYCPTLDDTLPHCVRIIP